MHKEDQNEELLTTAQAMKRLNFSRGTFFSRLKEHPEIKPANYNPNLRKQHNPVWRVKDVDALVTPADNGDGRRVA